MAVPILKMATVGILPSPVKRMYYRMKGAKIGKKVKIGFLSVITSNDIEIGDYSKIGMLTFIKARKVRIGKRVKLHMTVAIETGELEIGNDSSIMEQVIIGGMLTPRSKITIGKRVKIFPHSFINPTEPIEIGDDVGIGGANYIFTHGTWQNVLEGFPASFGPVTIEKGVWLPWRVFIMPNVRIGEYSIIGADSTVTKNVPARSLAAGSPATIKSENGKFIKQLNSTDKLLMVKKILAEFTEFINYSKSEKYSCIENESGCIISNKKSIEIIFSANYISNLSDKNYYVFLNALSDEQRNQLINQKIKWFDLEKKESVYFYKNELWEELKNFFSRYGIRFEYLN